MMIIDVLIMWKSGGFQGSCQAILAYLEVLVVQFIVDECIQEPLQSPIWRSPHYQKKPKGPKGYSFAKQTQAHIEPSCKNDDFQLNRNQTVLTGSFSGSMSVFLGAYDLKI